MHAFFLLFLLAVNVSVVSVKALAIAAAIYPLLQLAKKLFPALGGPWAIALNIALAALGFVVTVPSAQLVSVDTLVGLITAVSAAAGIHGTVKSLSNQ
jgi:hypothetical protein